MNPGAALRLLFVLCLSTCASTQAHASAVRQEELRIEAQGLSAKPLRVRVYLPPEYAFTQARYEVLYVNDGQDMEAVGMAATLERLYARYAITRIIVVAIDMPPDRMAGYGLFDRAKGHAIAAPTRYGEVGANAQVYAQWLTQALVPTIDARYRTLAHAEGRALLGWSLGALSAFGIGWQYPELFSRIGAFSPSFWLAADRRDAASVRATRIVHRLVDASPPMPRPQMFFGVGTQEEADDRDGDGVIDVLDDTRDLIDRVADRCVREACDGTDKEGVVLFLLEDGRHDQPSWARMLPAFLKWAYGRNTARQPSADLSGAAGRPAGACCVATNHLFRMPSAARRCFRGACRHP